jgi:hypothetical protein
MENLAKYSLQIEWPNIFNGTRSKRPRFRRVGINPKNTYRDPAVPLVVEEQESLLEIRQLVLRETHLLRHPFKKNQLGMGLTQFSGFQAQIRL